VILESHRSAGIAVDRENREKDDYYPTPPEATEALLRVERFQGAIWEPACGEGAISEVLKANGHDVVSTDLVNRGYGQYPIDFLMEYKSLAPNVITNPPFKLAVPFLNKSLSLTQGKVAMLLRLSFLEGIERRKIYESTPIARVHVFSWRVKMQRGRQATKDDVSGMFAMAWFVWEHGYEGRPTLGWI
jgi:hypothetical protein